MEKTLKMKTASLIKAIKNKKKYFQFFLDQTRTLVLLHVFTCQLRVQKIGFNDIEFDQASSVWLSHDRNIGIKIYWYKVLTLLKDRKDTQTKKCVGDFKLRVLFSMLSLLIYILSN